MYSNTPDEFPSFPIFSLENDSRGIYELTVKGNRLAQVVTGI